MAYKKRQRPTTRQRQVKKSDLIEIAVLLLVAVLVGLMPGCAFSVTGNASVDMSPNLQLGVSRSDQASGEGNEIWSEPVGGATIGADAIQAAVPAVLPVAP